MFGRLNYDIKQMEESIKRITGEAPKYMEYDRIYKAVVKKNIKTVITAERESRCTLHSRRQSGREIIDTCLFDYSRSVSQQSDTEREYNGLYFELSGTLQRKNIKIFAYFEKI